jgi:hypothetical protein
MDERRAIKTLLLGEAPPDLPDIHLNIVELYRAKVIRLGFGAARAGAVCVDIRR